MSRDPEDLDALVAAGLITEQQAQAIRAFDAEREGAVRSQRVPLITEALGYLGAGLAAAALGVLLSDQWSDLAAGVRLSIPTIGAVLLLIGGWLLRDSTEPAFARFGSVLWALSVASASWAAAILAADILDVGEAGVAMTIGVVATAAGVALYAVRRTPLQQIALGAGLIVLVTSAVHLWDPTSPAPAIGVAVWIVAVAWLVLAYRGVLVPRILAYGLGAFVALQGAQAVAIPEGTNGHAGMALGLLTAAVLIAASVWLREDVLLVFGAIGAFLFLVTTINHFFRDTLGTPLVLLITGVVLLAIAFLTMRLRRSTEHRSPAPRTG